VKQHHRRQKLHAARPKMSIARIPAQRCHSKDRQLCVVTAETCRTSARVRTKGQANIREPPASNANPTLPMSFRSRASLERRGNFILSVGPKRNLSISRISTLMPSRGEEKCRAVPAENIEKRKRPKHVATITLVRGLHTCFNADGNNPGVVERVTQKRHGVRRRPAR